MLRRASFVLLLSSFAGIQQPVIGWKDPSPHIARFVTVNKNLRLEVLDWGGSGRPLVLLAGGGDTAHVFDDFAPKLTAQFHVYGVTRRGFGESGFAATQSGGDQLGSDLLAVLDTLKLKKPVLVGHSIAGGEMSWLANAHPDRLAGLVYLEAAYPYAFDNGKVPTMKQFQSLQGPRPPEPAGPDLASFPALQQYYSRVLGFTYPEGELRQQRSSKPDGSVGPQRDFPGYAILMSAITDYKKYSTIPVPTLAIFANPHGQGKWVDSSPDPKVIEEAKAYSAALTPLTERQVMEFEQGVPKARVVELHGGNHYVYLSNEADVLREIKDFVRGLR
jgi:pimeloyl-ACP methyl ester carboxylesterase